MVQADGNDPGRYVHRWEGTGAIGQYRKKLWCFTPPFAPTRQASLVCHSDAALIPFRPACDCRQLYIDRVLIEQDVRSLRKGSQALCPSDLTGQHRGCGANQGESVLWGGHRRAEAPPARLDDYSLGRSLAIERREFIGAQ